MNQNEATYEQQRKYAARKHPFRSRCDQCCWTEPQLQQRRAEMSEHDALHSHNEGNVWPQRHLATAQAIQHAAETNAKQLRVVRRLRHF